MKKTLLTGIAALLLTTGAAHADGLLPPKKYDYLFPGPIVITSKSTPEKLVPICGEQKFLGGCSVRIAYVCQIFLLDDEWLERGAHLQDGVTTRNWPLQRMGCRPCWWLVPRTWGRRMA